MTDLKVFQSDNKVSQLSKKRVNWTARLAMIKHHFPTVGDVDWSNALRDNEIFARVVRDILKAQQHLSLSDDEQSVAGRKPNIELEEGMIGWRELMGRSYSEYPFTQSFRLLTTDRSTGKQHSLTMIARKTGISRSRVHRLINGQEIPDLRDMEMIAAGYKRKPSFFTEYRTAVIIGYLAERLEVDPDIGISLYETLVK